MADGILPIMAILWMGQDRIEKYGIAGYVARGGHPLSDYFPDVTDDPKLASVLRDRDIWKERARHLEAALYHIKGECDLRLRGDGSLDFIADVVEHALHPPDDVDSG